MYLIYQIVTLFFGREEIGYSKEKNEISLFTTDKIQAIVIFILKLIYKHTSKHVLNWSLLRNCSGRFAYN